VGVHVGAAGAFVRLFYFPELEVFYGGHALVDQEGVQTQQRASPQPHTCRESERHQGQKLVRSDPGERRGGGEKTGAVVVMMLLLFLLMLLVLLMLLILLVVLFLMLLLML